MRDELPSSCTLSIIVAGMEPKLEGKHLNESTNQMQQLITGLLFVV